MDIQNSEAILTEKDMESRKSGGDCKNSERDNNQDQNSIKYSRSEESKSLVSTGQKADNEESSSSWREQNSHSLNSQDHQKEQKEQGFNSSKVSKSIQDLKSNSKEIKIESHNIKIIKMQMQEVNRNIKENQEQNSAFDKSFERWTPFIENSDCIFPNNVMKSGFAESFINLNWSEVELIEDNNKIQTAILEESIKLLKISSNSASNYKEDVF